MDHHNNQFLRCCLRVTVGAAFALALSGDTVELKSGERLDGAFRQVGAAGVVIEAAGQSITIPLDKVQAIYFGAPPKARADVATSPFQLALDALKALRSVVGSSISYRDYTPRVLDTRVKVDRYLGSAGEVQSPQVFAVRAAMEAYELAAQAFPGLESSSIEASVGPNLLKACPAIKKVASAVQLAGGMRSLGLDPKEGVGLINGRPPIFALWSCAAHEIDEAERAPGESHPSDTPQ